jgi:hypothetical protein
MYEQEEEIFINRRTEKIRTTNRTRNGSKNTRTLGSILIAGLIASCFAIAQLIAPIGFMAADLQAAQAADSTGVTYYVAQDGSDSAAGTEAAPFKTISKAVEAAKAGDTVLVKTGIYNDHVTFSKSGTPEALITVRAADGAQPKIVADGSKYAFDFAGQSYISLEGLDISGSQSHLIRLESPSSTGNIIMSNVLHDSTDRGDGVRVMGAKETQIIKNKMFRVQYGVKVESSGSDGASSSTLIKGNEIYKPGVDCIYLAVPGITVDSNVLHDNNATYEAGEHADGVQVFMKEFNPDSKITFSNNIIDLKDQPGSQRQSNSLMLENAGKITIFNNVINGRGESNGINLKSCPDSKVFNNTVVDTANSTIYIHKGSNAASTNVKVYNNIASSIKVTNDGSESGQESGNNLVGTDPQFTDKAAGDFTLKSGSPAIDKGYENADKKLPYPATCLGGGERIVNGKIDIGAYEFGAKLSTGTGTIAGDTGGATTDTAVTSVDTGTVSVDSTSTDVTAGNSDATTGDNTGCATGRCNSKGHGDRKGTGCKGNADCRGNTSCSTCKKDGKNGDCTDCAKCKTGDCADCTATDRSAADAGDPTAVKGDRVTARDDARDGSSCGAKDRVKDVAKDGVRGKSCGARNCSDCASCKTGDCSDCAKCKDGNCEDCNADKKVDSAVAGEEANGSDPANSANCSTCKNDSGTDCSTCKNGDNSDCTTCKSGSSSNDPARYGWRYGSRNPFMHASFDGRYPFLRDGNGRNGKSSCSSCDKSNVKGDRWNGRGDNRGDSRCAIKGDTRGDRPGSHKKHHWKHSNSGDEQCERSGSDPQSGNNDTAVAGEENTADDETDTAALDNTSTCAAGDTTCSAGDKTCNADDTTCSANNKTSDPSSSNSTTDTATCVKGESNDKTCTCKCVCDTCKKPCECTCDCTADGKKCECSTDVNGSKKCDGKCSKDNKNCSGTCTKDSSVCGADGKCSKDGKNRNGTCSKRDGSCSKDSNSCANGDTTCTTGNTTGTADSTVTTQSDAGQSADTTSTTVATGNSNSHKLSIADLLDFLKRFFADNNK